MAPSSRKKLGRVKQTNKQTNQLGNEGRGVRENAKRLAGTFLASRDWLRRFLRDGPMKERRRRDWPIDGGDTRWRNQKRWQTRNEWKNQRTNERKKEKATQNGRPAVSQQTNKPNKTKENNEVVDFASWHDALTFFLPGCRFVSFWLWISVFWSNVFF